MSWVLDHSDAEGTDRLVLLSLANHAGQAPKGGAWESWPGVATIQREANLRRTRTVQESLARLEGEGVIVRVINGAPDNRIRYDRRPNLYRIVIPDGVPSSVTPHGHGVPSHAERGAVSRHHGVPSDGTQTVIEPSVEPNTRITASDADVTAAFDDWWQGWPKKVSKGAARTAFKKALKVTDLETLTTARDAYARLVRSRPDGMKFCKHASTWLNQECWDDEYPDDEPFDGGEQVVY